MASESEQSLCERRPVAGSGWLQVPVRKPPAQLLKLIEAAPAFELSESSWRRGSVRVHSALADLEYADRNGHGPEWAIIVTREPMSRRASDDEVKLVLQDFFGELLAIEDNHWPGLERSFFCSVDPKHRVVCECKLEETVIVDAVDGYRWSTPNDGRPCRGCEFAPLTGRPCPLHGGTVGPLDAEALARAYQRQHKERT